MLAEPVLAVASEQCFTTSLVCSLQSVNQNVASCLFTELNKLLMYMVNDEPHKQTLTFILGFYS